MKDAQVIGAGESMSPGNQIRALTAIRANKKVATIKAGKTVVRKNPKFRDTLLDSDRQTLVN